MFVSQSICMCLEFRILWGIPFKRVLQRQLFQNSFFSGTLCQLASPRIFAISNAEAIGFQNVIQEFQRWLWLLITALRQSIASHVSTVNPEYKAAGSIKIFHETLDIDKASLLSFVLGLDLGP